VKVRIQAALWGVAPMRILPVCGAAALCALVAAPASAQLIDRTLAPNVGNHGIAKSLEEQAGVGRGNETTPQSSKFIIARDPFRAIRRGRQIFQRKFTSRQGAGPLTGDGEGQIADDVSIGAGLADSCAACHGRPRGSAGAGGDVATRPDSRDAPHLFGLGLKEMLGDEITQQLRATRAAAIAEARRIRRNVTRELRATQGVAYGFITARPDGTVDTSRIRGVDADLRVKPFFGHGGTISMREFIIGAFNAEMGLESADPDVNRASRARARIVTPSGMVLDGSIDAIEVPPAATAADDPDGDGVREEIRESIVDFMEFYLLNYFKAAHGEAAPGASRGRSLMSSIGCTSCHIQDMTIARDRRVADVETVFDPARGNPFNRMFATATPLFVETVDRPDLPSLKQPAGGSFLVRDIFTDFKRHDLGPNFHENEYGGGVRRQFITTALWGVGSTGPYGHDGRSMTLNDVILRHGGEAQVARDRFAALSTTDKVAVVAFLQSLVLFPPDDTASNLDPGSRTTAGYPQFGHGSIRLGALFNNPADPE
jgi:hypothetical protein